MSWRIAVVKNTLRVTEAQFAEIEDRLTDEGYSMSVYKGKLAFDPDAMEFMDCVHFPFFKEWAKKHKLDGEIYFGSLDGDNVGKFWGYKFNYGHLCHYKGKIKWEQDFEKDNNG